MSFYKQLHRWFNVCLPYGVTWWYFQFITVTGLKYYVFKTHTKELLLMYPNDVYMIAFLSVVTILTVSLGKLYIDYHRQDN